MDILEIFDNFWAAFAIFAVVFIAYAYFTTKHSYSEKAKKAFESHLKGCGVDLVVWFSLLFIAIALGAQNLKAQSVFEHVIGTKLLSVSLVTWSMIFVPLAFSIHSAHKGFDYRPLAIGILLTVAFGYGIIYWVSMP